MSSASARSPGLWWRAVVSAACAGACVGLADVARAAVSGRELLQFRDALVVVGFYAACFAPCGLVAALIARLFEMPRRALHLLVAVGATFFFVGAWLNVSFLPGFTETLSILSDFVLLLVAALWFRNRYRHTALDGMRLGPWLVAGGVAAVAAAAATRLPARGEGPAPQAAADSARPNVLVVLCDTLRADRLGCYGHDKSKSPTSPEIDAFARDATLFRDCRSVTPWTKPSVASLLTGLPPTVHACQEQREVLVPQLETLPEVFRAAGWRTAAFVDNPFVSPEFGFGQGFDDFDGVRPRVVASGTLLGKALFMLSLHLPVGDAVREWCGLGEGERRGSEALRSALSATLGDAAGKPWFAYVHAMEPHLSNLRYEPTRVDAEAMGLPAGEPFIGPPAYNGILPFETTPPPTPEFVAKLEMEYDACVRGFSRQFGALIDELKRRGMLENTIVVLVADHGEEFHEHGGWTHGHSLHREVLHVPLIVRLPDSVAGAKASRGRTVDGVATLLDVFPTLVDLAGVRYPRGREARGGGMSLAPLFAPPASGGESSVPVRPVLSELTMGPVGLRSIREGRWVLIEAHAPGRSREQLFDDVSDPDHHNDRIDSEDLEAAPLRERLRHDFSVLEKARFAGEERDLDAETREQLKKLGYVK